MSTHMPGFQCFFMILHYFVLANLVTSSISVKTQIVNIFDKDENVMRYILKPSQEI